MRRRTVAFLALLALLGAVALVWAFRAGAGGPHEPVRATLSLAAALGAGDTAGFTHALAPRPFRFPEDHGPHPGFRTEWWYFTGNLMSPEGRRFGYELTFFRSALAARAGTRASDWAARDVYMAHFALTDSAGGHFQANERFERGAAGLAGARTSPWRVWLDDWSAASAADAAASAGSAPPVVGAHRATGAIDSGTYTVGVQNTAAPARVVSPTAASAHDAQGFWPLRLSARDSTGAAIDLVLVEGTPPAPQGQGGLSQKGPEPGNASFYYSLPRMPTSGWLELGGRRWRVSGESWMDREWSTSALAPDEVGWDWFGLQLSDGRALMLYRIRRRGGEISPYSAGTLIGADGSIRPLGRADVSVDVLGSWPSPLDGIRYPAHWRVTVPSADLALDIRPMVADQELNLSVRYWEGAVWLTGMARGRPLTGRGYVELTGYGGDGRARGRPGAEAR